MILVPDFLHPGWQFQKIPSVVLCLLFLRVCQTMHNSVHWLNLTSEKGAQLFMYSTVSARQLLFVWCSLSDDHQTIIRCLSDGPPDICQLPPNICQTSTTYTPDMYHMPTRHILPLVPDMYQTSTRYLSDVWYMSVVYVILV